MEGRTGGDLIGDGSTGRRQAQPRGLDAAGAMRTDGSVPYAETRLTGLGKTN